MSSPTRGSPLGCVVGMLSMLPLSLAVIGVYGCIRWYGLPEAKRPEGLLPVWIGCAAGGLLLTAALIWLAWRILRTTNWKSYDPEKPHSHM